jgi:hypothetical protein
MELESLIYISVLRYDLILEGVMTLSRETILDGALIELQGPWQQWIGEPRWSLSLESLKEVVASKNYSSFGKNVVESSWLLLGLLEGTCMDSPKDE